MKACSKCPAVIPVGDFGSHRSYCRACFAAYMRERNARDPRFREKTRRMRAKRMQDPDYRARYNLNSRTRRMKITIEQFDAMLATQGGKCAICPDAVSRLDIDHCHTRGHVRGLLCAKCNRGLGQFNDDADLIEKAAAYLRQRGSTPAISN